MKKESWKLVKTQKIYSKSDKCQKNSEKHQIFSLIIHKGAGIFKS